MRLSKDGFFVSFDNTQLFYRSWPASLESIEKSQPVPAKKKAIIFMHRGHEHSGRLQDLVDGVDLKEFWCFGYDARGHGQTAGPRGYAKEFMDLVRDLDAFTHYISKKYEIDINDIAVVANSVGAVIASIWVHDFAPKIRALVLAAPAFKVKLYVPLALPGLRVLDKIKHPAFISSYVKSKMLTHDINESRKYDEDKLITRNIAVNILIGLFDHGKRVVEDAMAIETPTLVLTAGKDYVVDTKIQKEFFNNLGSTDKEIEFYDGFYHGVLYEKEKHRPLSKIREFILKRFSEDTKSNFVNTNARKFSIQEYQRLKSRPSLLKHLNYEMTKLSMKTLGRLSGGISLGQKYGYDSGLMLNYVYNNKSTGLFGIGKFIDRVYLNAIGWMGIRERKKNLSSLLQKAVDKQLSKRSKIKIFDVAGGPGNYIMDFIRNNNDKVKAAVNAIVLDYKDENIETGKKNAKAYNLSNVEFIKTDIFSNWPINEKADIAIISGIFELESDNQKIQSCLKNVRERLSEDGIIIYTGQPWHPQLEFIAKTLNGHKGGDWVMRRRSQMELDDLFIDSGFIKEEMRIDNYGIFTVGLASTTENRSNLQ